MKSRGFNESIKAKTKQNKINITLEKDVITSANQMPGENKFTPLVASQQGQSIQHEPACFGLFSSWSFPSCSGIRLHAAVQLWLSLQRSVSPRNIPPLVLLFCAISPRLGCSRPLVGVDAESSEIVQEIPHPLFFLAHHTARAPPPILRTSRTSAVSYPLWAPQIPQTRSASCVKNQPMQRVKSLWRTRRRVS